MVLWERLAWAGAALRTEIGELVRVVYPGRSNDRCGADLIDVVVTIGDWKMPPSMPDSAVLKGRQYGSAIEQATKRNSSSWRPSSWRSLFRLGRGQALYRGIVGALGYSRNKTDFSNW